MTTATTARIVAAAAAGGTCIALEFADGTHKVVDVSGLLNGPVFARIAADEDAFARLFYDPELSTVCWPGEIDIAPESLASLPDVSWK